MCDPIRVKLLFRRRRKHKKKENEVEAEDEEERNKISTDKRHSKSHVKNRRYEWILTDLFRYRYFHKLLQICPEDFVHLEGILRLENRCHIVY